MNRSLPLSCVLLVAGCIAIAVSGWRLFSTYNAHAAAWPEQRQKLTAQTGQYSIALEERMLRSKLLKPYAQLLTGENPLNASQILLLDLLRQLEAEFSPLSQQFSIVPPTPNSNLPADLHSIEVSRLTLQLRFLHEKQFYDYLDQLHHQNVALLGITDLEIATVAATDVVGTVDRAQELKVSLGLHWYGHAPSRGLE